MVPEKNHRKTGNFAGAMHGISVAINKSAASMNAEKNRPRAASCRGT
jgi:hypothetical protein